MMQQQEMKFLLENFRKGKKEMMRMPAAPRTIGEFLANAERTTGVKLRTGDTLHVTAGFTVDSYQPLANVSQLAQPCRVQLRHVQPLASQQQQHVQQPQQVQQQQQQIQRPQQVQQIHQLQQQPQLQRPQQAVQAQQQQYVQRGLVHPQQQQIHQGLQQRPQQQLQQAHAHQQQPQQPQQVMQQALPSHQLVPAAHAVPQNQNVTSQPLHRPHAPLQAQQPPPPLSHTAPVRAPAEELPQKRARQETAPTPVRREPSPPKRKEPETIHLSGVVTCELRDHCLILTKNFKNEIRVSKKQLFPSHGSWVSRAVQFDFILERNSGNVVEGQATHARTAGNTQRDELLESRCETPVHLFKAAEGRVEAYLPEQNKKSIGVTPESFFGSSVDFYKKFLAEARVGSVIVFKGSTSRAGGGLEARLLRSRESRRSMDEALKRCCVPLFQFKSSYAPHNRTLAKYQPKLSELMSRTCIPLSELWKPNDSVSDKVVALSTLCLDFRVISLAYDGSRVVVYPGPYSPLGLYRALMARKNPASTYLGDLLTSQWTKNDVVEDQVREFAAMLFVSVCRPSASNGSSIRTFSEVELNNPVLKSSQCFSKSHWDFCEDLWIKHRPNADGLRDIVNGVPKGLHSTEVKRQATPVEKVEKEQERVEPKPTVVETAVITPPQPTSGAKEAKETVGGNAQFAAPASRPPITTFGSESDDDDDGDLKAAAPEEVTFFESVEGDAVVPEAARAGGVTPDAEALEDSRIDSTEVSPHQEVVLKELVGSPPMTPMPTASDVFGDSEGSGSADDGAPAIVEEWL